MTAEPIHPNPVGPTGPRLLDTIENIVRAIIAAVTSLVIQGKETRVQAAQDALEQLTSRGITGYSDTSGRSWDLAAYVSMAIRTLAAHEAINSYLDGMQAKGLDLVTIQTGPRHCPICEEWDGKVLSVSGATVGEQTAKNPATGKPVTFEVYASVADARAGGWGHPNCRCRLVAYLPGVTKLDHPTYDLAEYEAQQRQRDIERNIRAWKRREAAAITPEAKARAVAYVKAWQARMREHLAANEYLKRQPGRERVGAH